MPPASTTSGSNRKKQDSRGTGKKVPARSVGDSLRALQDAFRVPDNPNTPSRRGAPPPAITSTSRSAVKVRRQEGSASHGILTGFKSSFDDQKAASATPAQRTGPSSMHDNTSVRSISGRAWGKRRLIDEDEDASEGDDGTFKYPKDRSEIPEQDALEAVGASAFFSPLNGFNRYSTPVKDDTVGRRSKDESFLQSSKRDERQPDDRTREETVDLKPLRALDTGFLPLSKRVKANIQAQEVSEASGPRVTGQQQSDSDTKSVQPRWKALLPVDVKDEEQDIAELLSPRKKRKGWVPNGLAERASQLIKRHQTSHTLWMHEMGRLLAPPTPKIKTEASSAKTGHVESKRAHQQPRNLNQLKLDLNPQLRLRILAITSDQPASLAHSASEGGFLTAGFAEKLLLTRCLILQDAEDEHVDVDDRTRDTLEGTYLADEHSEGLVLFSLAEHARSGATTSLAQRPPRSLTAPNLGDNRAGAEHNNGSDGGSGQSTIPYNPVSSMGRTVFLPASVADLHTQLVVDDEIWVWEPWSIVEQRKPDALTTTSTAGNGEGEYREQNEDAEPLRLAIQKVLLVSRFGVLH